MAGRKLEMMRKFFCIVSVVLGLGAAAAEAATELSLPGVFSDHMVLQRGMAAPVWGHGGEG